MSTVTNPQTETYIAGADLSSKAYYALKLNTAGKVVLAAEGQASIGTLTSNVANSKAASVAVIGGNTLGIAGAAFNVGDNLMSDANGKFITATASKYVIATALEEATAADAVVGIKNVLFYK